MEGGSEIAYHIVATFAIFYRCLNIEKREVVLTMVTATMLATRGVRRIGLTSLNPMVCLSSQSESDPKMKKVIRSDPKKYL